MHSVSVPQKCLLLHFDLIIINGRFSSLIKHYFAKIQFFTFSGTVCKDQSRNVMAFSYYRALKSREEGTFLLRRKQDHHFVLSFHFAQMVYNVNITKQTDNDLLVVGGVPVIFETITDLIDKFQRLPIYANITLKKGPQNLVEDALIDDHVCKK